MIIIIEIYYYTAGIYIYRWRVALCEAPLRRIRQVFVALGQNGFCFSLSCRFCITAAEEAW